jgi:hypothetical protein
MYNSRNQRFKGANQRSTMFAGELRFKSRYGAGLLSGTGGDNFE